MLSKLRSIKPRIQVSRLDALKEMIRAWVMNPEEILVKNAMTQPSRTAGNLVEDQAQPWVYKHVGKYLFRISPSGTISCFGGNRERITVALSELFTSLKNIGIAVPEKTVIKFHNIASEMKLRESCACGKPSIS